VSGDLSMRGVWTAIIVDQWGQVHHAPAPNPEPYHRIMVVRALLGADHVDDIRYETVLYEAQGWKDPAVEWFEARQVAAALNVAQVSQPAAALVRVRELVEQADADPGVRQGGVWEDPTPVEVWTAAVRNTVDGRPVRTRRESHR
jgi:hypothetical protein